MNITILSGRASREIELRFTPSGKPVANGSMAVQRRFKNAQGDYEADFIDFIAWGKTGELMAEHIKKGEHFTLSGELTTRIWEKQDGSKQKIVEVNVDKFDFPVRAKGSKESNNTSNQLNTPQSSHKEPQMQFDNDPFANDGTPIDISDDDLPF